MKIIRNTGKKALETSVHRKSTFSGVFTNFKSSVPMTFKLGCFFDNVLSLFFNNVISLFFDNVISLFFDNVISLFFDNVISLFFNMLFLRKVVTR